MGEIKKKENFMNHLLKVMWFFVAFFVAICKHAVAVVVYGQEVKRSVDSISIVSPMILDGNKGLQIENDPLLQLKKGFSIECRICPSDVSTCINIVTKDGEYLLRINNPKREDGTISFFVNLDGHWEPRVRSVKPKPNSSYHIIATWDGSVARLWVNGMPFEVRRIGQMKPTDAPVIIGSPTRWASQGFVGTIESFTIYNRLLSIREIIERFYLPEQRIKPMMSTDFGFDKDAEGWQVSEGMKAECKKGFLSLMVSDPESFIRSPLLDIDTAANRFISLRMSVDKGRNGCLTFITEKGVRSLPFALKADGEMHTYIFPALGYPEWQDKLLQLLIQPSDKEGAKVMVDFIKVASVPVGDAEVEIKVIPDKAVCRALRNEDVIAIINNRGADVKNLSARLIVPDGVNCISEASQEISSLDYDEQKELRWTVQATKPLKGRIAVVVSGAGMTKDMRAECTINFSEAMKLTKSSYVPEPNPVKNKYLIGINYFPGWKGTNYGWQKIERWPERKPALGWYDEGSPEVSDWEIKWCLEHGISFFNYCWYHQNISQSKQLLLRLEHALNDGLLKSKYVPMFKFTIMYENRISDISAPSDFTEIVFPYWLEHYFTNSSYLKVDNKPILFIYLPDKLRRDLGGSENVKKAFEVMRQKCREKGLDGLIIVAMYHYIPPDPAEMKILADEGYDATSAYIHAFINYKGFSKCPHGEHIHSPDEAIRMHEEVWQMRKESSSLPYILNLTMGWDRSPWNHFLTHSVPWVLNCRWVIPPEQFKVLCRKAKEIMDGAPSSQLDSKILLIDNWNEWGEGHYVAPCRQYGFGYLDAIREIFATDTTEHLDLIPEDVGLGPYDSSYRKYKEQMLRRAWEFNTDGDVEGWTLLGLDQVQVKDGYLSVRSVHNDPQLYILDVDIPPQKYSKVVIRMAVDKDSDGQLFWRTNVAESFNQPMSIRFKVIGDGKFHEYEIEVGKHRLWYGRVVDLRFDPVCVPDARIQIDYIRLIGK